MYSVRSPPQNLLSYSFELMKRMKEEMFMKESVCTCRGRQEKLRKQITEHKGGEQ